MQYKTIICPNCGANYNPLNYRCEYCGSYVFISHENYRDFSGIPVHLPPQTPENTAHYPGVYVFGRLLGKGERPITLGVANYQTGLLSAGGKLLLTNRSLSFSAHEFNVGRKETTIDLQQVSNAWVSANMLISQSIAVAAAGKTHHFVVYHGKEWVRHIHEACAALHAPAAPAAAPAAGNYIAELQQLKQLLDLGVITEEEFQLKKRQILGI